MGRYSKINDAIQPGFKLVRDYIHAHLNLCGRQSKRLFQQLRGRNSKINDLIWQDLKLILEFNNVHLICKFQEDPIKT